jgi:hypothetical protein
LKNIYGATHPTLKGPILWGMAAIVSVSPEIAAQVGMEILDQTVSAMGLSFPVSKLAAFDAIPLLIQSNPAGIRAEVYGRILELVLGVLREGECQSRLLIESAIAVWSMIAVVTQREIEQWEMELVLSFFPIRGRAVNICFIARFVIMAAQKWLAVIDPVFLRFAAKLFGGDSYVYRLVPAEELALLAQAIAGREEAELAALVENNEGALLDLQRRLQELAAGTVSQM